MSLKCSNTFNREALYYRGQRAVNLLYADNVNDPVVQMLFRVNPYTQPLRQRKRFSDPNQHVVNICIARASYCHNRPLKLEKVTAGNREQSAHNNTVGPNVDSRTSQTQFPLHFSDHFHLRKMQKSM